MQARSDLTPTVERFARECTQYEGESLLDCIRRTKPTILLGLSGAGRLFTHQVRCRPAAALPVLLASDRCADSLACCNMSYYDDRMVSWQHANGSALGSPEQSTATWKPNIDLPFQLSTRTGSPCRLFM